MRFFEYPCLPYDNSHTHQEKVAALTRVVMEAMQTFRSGPGQIYLRGRVDSRSQMGVLGFLEANHGFNFSSRLTIDNRAILPDAQIRGTLIHISRK